MRGVRLSERGDYLANSKMRRGAVLEILLFAAARQRVGKGCVELSIELPATIEEIRAALISDYPDLAGLINTSRWAVDQNFVEVTAAVLGIEEVALIPPVSGG